MIRLYFVPLYLIYTSFHIKLHTYDTIQKSHIYRSYRARVQLKLLRNITAIINRALIGQWHYVVEIYRFAQAQHNLWIIPFNRSPFFPAAVVHCALRVLGNLLLGKSKRMRERNELANAARGTEIRSTSRNYARNWLYDPFTAIDSSQSRSVMLTLTVNATQWLSLRRKRSGTIIACGMSV